jgi:uncharacterized membrane protein (UPF0127 family)
MVNCMKGTGVNKRWLGVILMGAVFTARADCPPADAQEVRVGAQAWRVEVARDAASRERGLSGRDQLARGEGMLFVFETPYHAGFWMKDMRFPLDIVWIGTDHRVQAISPMAPCVEAPCPISYPTLPAALVLEVNLGEFAGAAGDALDWRCRP